MIKIKKKIFDLYGVDNPTKIPGVRKNIGNMSYQHKTVEKWLIENNIINILTPFLSFIR